MKRGMWAAVALLCAALAAGCAGRGGATATDAGDDGTEPLAQILDDDGCIGHGGMLAPLLDQDQGLS